LYGVYFILEINVNILTIQFNRLRTDLPSTLFIRWLAWIRLFNFEIRHVSGIKYIAVNSLSRRPRTASDNIDKIYEKDIDNFITAELNTLSI
jgi:hypothetical protein